MATVVRNAQQAAEALVRAFGPSFRFGELTVKVSEGRVTVVKHLDSLSPHDLSLLDVPDEA